MATTNRDWADKDWLKERRPFPVLVMDVVAAIFGAGVLLGLIVAAIALSSPARADEQRAGADWKVFLPLYFRNRDPVNAPRCPRENARGELLEHGIATQADGGEWLIDCRYSAQALRL